MSRETGTGAIPGRRMQQDLLAYRRRITQTGIVVAMGIDDGISFHLAIVSYVVVKYGS